MLAQLWLSFDSFGLAWVGFSLLRTQARPSAMSLAWPGLALAQATAKACRGGGIFAGPGRLDCGKFLVELSTGPIHVAIDSYDSDDDDMPSLVDMDDEVNDSGYGSD
ncbi:hypothetical protein C8J56DRAFT_891131 [Mycena floridula]|nr:hypothetical protein C8J56DRAFT_891131 [Mycena floridula]